MSKRKRRQMQKRKPPPLTMETIEEGLSQMVALGLAEPVMIEGKQHYRMNDLEQKLRPHLNKLTYQQQVRASERAWVLIVHRGQPPEQAWRAVLRLDK